MARRTGAHVKQTLTQFSRYIVVGIASNSIGYLLYIVLTSLGLGPKLAMTLLYCVGVMQTFFFNRKWSFGFEGNATSAMVRYTTIYLLGYLIQLVALMQLVDRAGLPHQWVMAVLIVVMAVFFFLGQKYWVFRLRTAPEKRQA